MTPCIDEAKRFLRLAERDYRSFAILADHPDADAAAACFHSPQSVEKPIKAVRRLHRVHTDRAHNAERSRAWRGIQTQVGEKTIVIILARRAPERELCTNY